MNNKKEQHENHNKAFLNTDRRHVLLITNHGIQEWDGRLGLPDTGGQVLFVNELSQQLANVGFKVTVVNRGGFKHMETGEMRTGLSYRNDNERLLYIEDSKKEFVRKEDMDEQLPELSAFLADFITKEGQPADLIISNYWDAAKLGALYNKTLPNRLKHIWIPHSLGALKKRNMPEETWAALRIDERIENERAIIKELDGIAATSSAIRESLKNDYNYETTLFLPPCVHAEKYFPGKVEDTDPLWGFLAESSPMSAEEIREKRIVTEVSRTDSTKRKNIVVEAFAMATEKMPDTFLVIAVDQHKKELFDQISGLIDKHGIRERTSVIGWAGDHLPAIYRATSVYCTPSVMEGFGMAAQEAAASGSPVVASDLVPFVKEYLLGQNPETLKFDDADAPLQQGEGAIMVRADDTNGFAHAVQILLEDETLRVNMGKAAYNITIPYFTWSNMVKVFLEEIGEQP